MRLWGVIGLEGSNGSSNDVPRYFSDYLFEGVTETSSQQLPCLEVFKQEIVPTWSWGYISKISASRGYSQICSSTGVFLK